MNNKRNRHPFAKPLNDMFLLQKADYSFLQLTIYYLSVLVSIIESPITTHKAHTHQL